MERERGDAPEDLGREVPERREAAARAAAPVGLVLWREHGGELVEMVASVGLPVARVDYSFDIRVVCLGNFGAGAHEHCKASALQSSG